MVVETLTPEEQEFWDKYPTDQKKIENGVHIVMTEHSYTAPLVPKPLKTYFPQWKDKMRNVEESRRIGEAFVEANKDNRAKRGF
jgi:hypothetical protein